MIKRIILFTVLSFLLAITSTLYFITATNQGLQTTLHFVSHLMPGTLQIQKIEGTLLTGVSLVNISYRHPSLNTTIESLSIQWNPKALLHAQLEISALTLNNAHLAFLENKATHSSFAVSNLDFLKHITVNNINIKNFSVEKNELYIKGSGEITQNWNMQWQINIPQMGKLIPQGKGSLSSSGNISGPKHAPIILATLNLNLLKNLIPALKNPQGKVQARIQLGGSLENPVMVGNAMLANGRITLPDLGITLQNITLHAQLKQNQELNYTGIFQIKKEIAHLQGSTDLMQPGLPTTVTLYGVNLPAINLSDVQATISPNITLNLVGQTLKLSGTLEIPQARITPINFGDTVTLPSDVVFTSQAKAPVQLPFLMNMHINLNLSKDIYLHYNNLETTLRGNLLITQNANSPLTATGALYTTSGTYNAFGKVLTIQEGRLIYTGGQLTNPGLNIKAVRTINVMQANNINNFTNSAGTTNFPALPTGTTQVTAGIQVTGTLNSPALTLFSLPSDLSQSDILSYLLFGYPQSQASSSDSQAILSTASILNFGGTNIGGMTKQIQEQLGLSELNIEATQMFDPTTNTIVQTPSVVLSKQIAPSLYIRYSQGLTYTVPIVSLHYIISKRFSLQSQTSTLDNGVDLLYEVERGD